MIFLRFLSFGMFLGGLIIANIWKVFHHNPKWQLAIVMCLITMGAYLMGFITEK